MVCQKSKINDWIKHFTDYYHDFIVYDGTKQKCLELFLKYPYEEKQILVINYDLVFRRPELLKIPIGTLMLDESSLIQNETTKRSKAILKMNTKNVILLSGTPTGGKYEKLWSQARLLGWNISKDLFYRQYIDFEWREEDGFWRQVINGYKNTDRMIRKFKEHGAHFLKTEEVFDLPSQTFIPIKVPVTGEYRTFRKNDIVQWNNIELIGDTPLTKMLYERQLCGQYNANKFHAFEDILESTNDRLIVFYNFTEELNKLIAICKEQNRPTNIINGQIKENENYENCSDSITLVQYQAGAMGLNLQKANKIIYFTPPLSSELYEQSKKRIHRIGQDQPCFYYNLICKGSIEERIYENLAMRRDYTERLFESDGNKSFTNPL